MAYIDEAHHDDDELLEDAVDLARDTYQSELSDSSSVSELGEDTEEFEIVDADLDSVQSSDIPSDIEFDVEPEDSQATLLPSTATLPSFRPRHHSRTSSQFELSYPDPQKEWESEILPSQLLEPDIVVKQEDSDDDQNMCAGYNSALSKQVKAEEGTVPKMAAISLGSSTLVSIIVCLLLAMITPQLRKTPETVSPAIIGNPSNPVELAPLPPSAPESVSTIPPSTAEAIQPVRLAPIPQQLPKAASKNASLHSSYRPQYLTLGPSNMVVPRIAASLQDYYRRPLLLAAPIRATIGNSSQTILRRINDMKRTAQFKSASFSWMPVRDSKRLYHGCHSQFERHAKHVRSKLAPHAMKKLQHLELRSERALSRLEDALASYKAKTSRAGLKRVRRAQRGLHKVLHKVDQVSSRFKAEEALPDQMATFKRQAAQVLRRARQTVKRVRH